MSILPSRVRYYPIDERAFCSALLKQVFDLLRTIPTELGVRRYPLFVTPLDFTSIIDFGSR